ncbi:dihydrodipicolinate synthase family protein [Methylobacterium durans]|uniref:dihydrodipicolinate synthase family protein n=1 Tax=Methylobacterium durans TaxID=2202825 RepID=UPI002AFF6987|nr:dihydrodipicolinate synthase family protein [Methylobacterium durans]MEA1833179.1 dihydrodipicolinate synthase family protein [Methylobacterium durans]
MRLFHGLSAFPLTPADASGRVDTEAQGRLLDPLCAAGVDSIGLLGSTGIYAYLTRGERLRAVRAAVARVGGRTPLLVGIGALRTDQAQGLARDAADAGADALLLAPVSYTPLTQGEVYEHVRAVARATDLPICLYNNPGTTHFTFGRELIERLAGLETVAAVKMPLPADGDFADELTALRRCTALSIGYSGDWGAADALLAGADAWYSVVAGLLPRLALSLVRAARAGDEAEVRRIDERCRPLWDTFRTFGSLRVMYVLQDLLALGTAEPPRPLLPLGDADRERVAEALAALRAGEAG